MQEVRLHADVDAECFTFCVPALLDHMNTALSAHKRTTEQSVDSMTSSVVDAPRCQSRLSNLRRAADAWATAVADTRPCCTDRKALQHLPGQYEAALLEVHATWVAYVARERTKAAAPACPASAAAPFRS